MYEFDIIQSVKINGALRQQNISQLQSNCWILIFSFDWKDLLDENALENKVPGNTLYFMGSGKRLSIIHFVLSEW